MAPALSDILAHGHKLAEGPSFQETLDQERSDAVVFTLRIALSLQRFGLPSHRLEETMLLLDHHLGLESRFFCSPTLVLATFGYDSNQRTYMFRPHENELNLEKLDAVFTLAREVGLGKVSTSEGLKLLAALEDAPPRYGQWLMNFCFVVSSAGAARLFGGGWREILVAGFIGGLVSLLINLAPRVPAIGRILIPLASVLAMATAKLATLALGPYSLFIATVTGLIVLLPGLSLTTAVTELAQGNAVSGTSKFALASVTFLMMAFGIAIGGKVDLLILGETILGAEPEALPYWTAVVAWCVVPLSFVVLFQAHPRDTHWVFVSGILAFHVSSYAGAHLGYEMGAFTSALVLALYGNIHARYFRRPSSLTLVPGIMLLVPGSLGFRSLQALLNHQTLPGLETAFTMIMVAVALVAGLIFAGILVPPRSPIPTEPI